MRSRQPESQPEVELNLELSSTQATPTHTRRSLALPIHHTELVDNRLRAQDDGRPRLRSLVTTSARSSIDAALEATPTQHGTQ